MFYFSLSFFSKNQSAENLENPSDQVIEERLVYTLSREYIEMLGEISVKYRSYCNC